MPPSPKAPGAPRPGTYVYRAGAPPPRPPPQWQPPPPAAPAPQKPPPPKKKWSADDMYDSDGNEKFDVTTSDEDSDAEAAPAPGTYVYQARAPPPEKPKRRRRRDTYDSDDPPSDCVSEEEYKPRGSKRRPRAAKKRR